MAIQVRISGGGHTSRQRAEHHVVKGIARWLYSSRGKFLNEIEFIADDPRVNCEPRLSMGLPNLGPVTEYVHPMIADSGMSLTPMWPDAAEMKKRVASYRQSMQTGPIEHKYADF